MSDKFANEIAHSFSSLSVKELFQSFLATLHFDFVVVCLSVRLSLSFDFITSKLSCCGGERERERWESGEGTRNEERRGGGCCGSLSPLALCSGFKYHARFHS